MGGVNREKFLNFKGIMTALKTNSSHVIKAFYNL